MPDRTRANSNGLGQSARRDQFIYQRSANAEQPRDFTSFQQRIGFENLFAVHKNAFR